MTSEKPCSIFFLTILFIIFRPFCNLEDVKKGFIMRSRRGEWLQLIVAAVNHTPALLVLYNTDGGQTVLTLLYEGSCFFVV